MDIALIRLTSIVTIKYEQSMNNSRINQNDQHKYITILFFKKNVKDS